MKNLAWLTLALGSLAAISAFAEEPLPYDGFPVLPAPALATHFDVNGAPASIAYGLKQIATIEWEVPPAGDTLEEAIYVPGFSASLLMEPTTRALPNGPAPRDCGDVRRERREVRARIQRVAELRAEIEAGLDHASRACGRSPRGTCNSGAVDKPLTELNDQISQLRAYAEREAASTADRSVVYRFHLDGAAGLPSLRQGWRPVGTGMISRVRFPRGPWLTGATLVLSGEGTLAAAPQPLLNGTWVISRTLTATHACATSSVFNIEFESGWQKNPAPEAGADGTALPDAAINQESVLIRGIAL